MSVYQSPPGLTKRVVENISTIKCEPQWMRDFRLESLEIYRKASLPKFGVDLSKLDFKKIRYYVRPTDSVKNKWSEVPADIKKTFDKLGIPKAERDFLGGVGGQYDSENVYHNLQKKLSRQGVIFSDVETALRTHPKIVKKYFASVI